jgi:hypothetical protein
MKKRITYTAAALAAAFGAIAEQRVISVNYAANLSDTDQTIDAGETYGVSELNTVVGNWYNAGYPGLNDMIWDNGETSTVGSVVSAPGGIAAHNPPGNTTMANTVLYAGPTDWGADPGFTIYGMADSFAEGYSVIVYLTGKNWAGNAYISDGTTTYYYNTPGTYATNLIQTTSTDSNSVPEATYAVFSNLNANALTFKVGGLSGGGVSIGGFQIVGEQGSFLPPAPDGLIIGWDAGAGEGGAYRMGDAKGNLWGGPWPANAFAGSRDGTFGTRAGAADSFNMASVMNNSGSGSDVMHVSVGWTSAVPVRVDSLHFDIGRASNSFDTVTLYEVVDAATNLIYSVGGLPITGAVGDFADVDVLLTNISDNVLANGQTLNFLLVGGNSISNDANMFLDNTAFWGEPISHYEGWAYTYGDIGTETDDPDGDDLNNFGEYAFGGNPTNGNNVGYLPSAGAVLESGTTNYIEYIYTKRITDGSSVNYTIEQRDDLILGDWTNSTDYIEVGTGIVTSNQFLSVTNWIPTDGKSEEFLRVIAE